MSTFASQPCFFLLGESLQAGIEPGVLFFATVTVFIGEVAITIISVMIIVVVPTIVPAALIPHETGGEVQMDGGNGGKLSGDQG